MEGTFVGGGSNQWLGQARGYEHNVEADFFEADYVTKPTAYGSGLHDWYGIPRVTCPSGLCVVQMLNPSGERDPPLGTNFNEFHTYGVLWMPATSTTLGSWTAFFDGRPVGHTRYWSEFTNQPPTPVGKPWVFGHVDQEHIFFILGTGRGEPFTVKSVNVWQRNAASNISTCAPRRRPGSGANEVIELFGRGRPRVGGLYCSDRHYCSNSNKACRSRIRCQEPV
jgi:hypothetical protein